MTELKSIKFFPGKTVYYIGQSTKEGNVVIMVIRKDYESKLSAKSTEGQVHSYYINLAIRFVKDHIALMHIE